jgi:hypothetical protein
MLDLQPPRHTSTLRSPDGSSRRLAGAADRDRGRLSWWMADIRKPALPNGRSATLRPRAQKGLSERERVDRVVGGDIESVFGGDERLKMVQTAHCLRRSCERFAAIGPERVQPVVALGAHDQYDRIRAAVGCGYDRRAGAFDGTTPRGLDRWCGVDANFQRNQTVRRFTSRTMRAIALQNDKYPVGGAPNRRRRDGDVCGHPRVCERAADAAEVVAIEKISLASLSDGEDQLPGAVRAHDIERDRRGPAEVEVATIKITPIRRGEIVAGFDRAREVGRKAKDSLAIAPAGCAKPAGCAECVSSDREKGLSIAADAALRPYAAAARARREARDLARLVNGNADDKTVIRAAIAPVSAKGNEDLVLKQRQRAALVLY